MTTLVFDCDGVLADTERFGHLPAFNQTFEEFGLPVRWSEQEYGERLLIGGGKERMASEIVDLMLDAVVPDLPFESGDEVAVMINGLGGTTIGELYLLCGIAHKKLEAKGIKVFRSYVNEYCTSLEMAGASLTLLKVDDELKHLLNEPAEVSIRVF